MTRRSTVCLGVVSLLLLALAGMATASPSGRQVVPVLADLDGDGIRDTVVATTDGVRIQWADAETATLVLPSREGIFGIAAADADGDGDLDVFALLNSGLIIVCHNHGQGQFAPARRVTPSSGLGAERAAVRRATESQTLVAATLPRVDPTGCIPECARGRSLDRAGPLASSPLSSFVSACLASSLSRGPPLSH